MFSLLRNKYKTCKIQNTQNAKSSIIKCCRCLIDVSDEVCPARHDMVGHTKPPPPLPRPLPDAFGLG